MTLESLAAALGINERSIRRAEASLLAKLQRAFADTEHSPELVVKAIVVVLAEKSETKSVGSKIPRRFSRESGEVGEHAPHVSKDSLWSDASRLRRAGHALPRRFPGKKP